MEYNASSPSALIEKQNFSTSKSPFRTFMCLILLRRYVEKGLNIHLLSAGLNYQRLNSFLLNEYEYMKHVL